MSGSRTQSEAKGHRAIMKSLGCPVAGVSQRPIQDLLLQKKSQIENALAVGLIAGILCFAGLRKLSGKNSISTASSLALGFLVTYFRFRNLKTRYPLPNFKQCPVIENGVGHNAFFAGDSISRRVAVDHSRAVGSQAAGLLQQLRPELATLVELAGNFRADTLLRGERTAWFEDTTVLGTTKMALGGRAKLKRVHGCQKSTYENGEEFSALKQVFLLWVHTSHTWMMLRTYAMLGLNLSPAEENRFVKEQVAAAHLRGIENLETVPDTVDKVNEFMTKIMQERTNKVDLATGEKEFLLKLTDDAIAFRDHVLKWKSLTPSPLINATIHLVDLASVSLLTQEQQKRLGIKSSWFKDFIVLSVTKLMMQALRLAIPDDEMRAYICARVAAHPYGGKPADGSNYDDKENEVTPAQLGFR